MEDYEFSTPKDFKTPDSIKKEGDTYRALVDLECIAMDEDGTKHWEIKAIDGVKMPDEDEGNQEGEAEDGSGDDEGAMDQYDTSQDETDEGETPDMTAQGKPKTTKGVGLLILAHPKK